MSRTPPHCEGTDALFLHQRQISARRVRIDFVNSHLNAELVSEVQVLPVARDCSMTGPRAESLLVRLQRGEDPSFADRKPADKIFSQVRDVQHFEPRVGDDHVRVCRRLADGVLARDGRVAGEVENAAIVDLLAKAGSDRVESERGGGLAVVCETLGVRSGLGGEGTDAQFATPTTLPLGKKVVCAGSTENVGLNGTPVFLWSTKVIPPWGSRKNEATYPVTLAPPLSFTERRIPTK